MNAIEDRRKSMGEDEKRLGLPAEAERSCSDEIGCFRRFEHGVIYSHPEVGTHVVLGAIADKWFELGGESGFLGYPVREERSVPGGYCSSFQGGDIYQIGNDVFVMDLTADALAIHELELQAKPLPYNPPSPDTSSDVLDYSSDINFFRNQQPCGGCMTYALLHIVDILKDWEHPYTPALSYRYVDWFRVDYVNKGKVGFQLWTAWDHGVAPEGLCHTDFDKEYDPTKADKEYDPTKPSIVGLMPWKHEPSAEAQDAAFYHIKMKMYGFKQPAAGESMSPSVEEIKELLRRYGPVWIAGSSHATAIVGYDDLKGQFKIVDSYVNISIQSGENIFHLASYDQIHKNVSTFGVVVNIQTPERVAGRHAFSARIRIEGCWRGTYTVSVGVEGREPLVVWTTRGRASNLPWEPSRVLAIDVPLPDYAGECWPPCTSNRWFLRVEDHDRDEDIGKITEFTLARRYIVEACKTIGRYHTETYGGSQDVMVPDPTGGPKAPFYAPLPTPNPDPGVATVHIPDDGTPMKGGGGPDQLVTFSITLKDQGKTPSYVYPVQEILTGRLEKYWQGKWSGMPGKKVTLFVLDQGACVNKPSKWDVLADTVTGTFGTFDFKVAAPVPIISTIMLGKRYYAVAYRSNLRVLASSEAVGIELSDMTAPNGKLIDLGNYEIEQFGNPECHPEW